MLGVSRQSLNKAVSGLAARGWIASGDHVVRLADLPSLERSRANVTEPLLIELANIARAVAPVVTPDGSAELLSSLTETARALFGAGARSLALLTDDEDDLHYVAAAGTGAETVIGMRIGAPASTTTSGCSTRSPTMPTSPTTPSCAR
jgi:hypothetical protein